jgi:hypothetical protein
VFKTNYAMLAAVFGGGFAFELYEMTLFARGMTLGANIYAV